MKQDESSKIWMEDPSVPPLSSAGDTPIPPANAAGRVYHGRGDAGFADDVENLARIARGFVGRYPRLSEESEIPKRALKPVA